jgi:hypothetical protein
MVLNYSYLLKLISGKQDKLTLKTVDGTSLIGSGDIDLKTVAGQTIVGSGDISFKTVSGQPIVGSGDISVGVTSTAGITSWTNVPYDVAFSVYSKPTASEKLFRFRACRAFTVPTSQTNAQARAATQATNSTTFTIEKNGTNIGSIVFGAGSIYGTVTISSATSFAVGDLLTVTAASTPDSTLADIDISILAVLN